MRREGVQLRLFGQIAWMVDGEPVDLVAGRPCEIAAILSARQPSWTSVDTIIEELWDVPPSSGANAVQRHVSRLRRQISDVFSCNPNDVIESSSAGYRWSQAVITDLSDVAMFERPAPMRWWEPPLGGVDSNRLVLVRARLSVIAAERFRSWCAESIASGSAVTALRLTLEDLRWRADPGDLTSMIELLDAADDPPLVRTVARALLDDAVVHPVSADVAARLSQLLDADRSEQPLVDYRLLAACRIAALDGRVDEAFDVLDHVAVPDDVRRRVARWLVWLSPDDGFARVMWTELTGLPDEMQPVAERTMVSLDAFALEHMPDSIEQADADIESASTDDDLVRSLRVRFMVGLGLPIDADQRQVVRRLIHIDHPDANVEAPRFEAILAAKAGDPTSAIGLLDKYESMVRTEWSSSMDDTAVLYRIVFADAWPGGVRAEPGQLTPIVTNQGTLDILELTRLVLPRVEPFTPDERRRVEGLRHHVRRCSRTEAARAYDLLLALGDDDVDEAAEIASEMTPIWLETTPNRHRHLGLIALGRYAERRGDAELAARVVQTMWPWRDEQLGIWPMDVLLGAAADWIARFEAV